MGARWDLNGRARRLKTDVPAVFLAMRRRETPVLAKVLAGCAVAYALSPIDLIPDFIPVLGVLDDLLILPGLVAWTVKMIPADVFEACRAEAQGMWADGKPKRWIYAVPLVAIWAVVVWLVVRALV